ncbi:MAG TPA: TIGR01458 family HAD-type hydrolase [Gammaproteobacteria bacterium]|nr:TIGR01458 family HAD-type hydrolase [Gammaproteobacteria bacterium]
MICGVLLDLSGVLYVGKAPIAGALDALERLARLQVPVRFITNTSRKTRRQVVEQLTGMGFTVNPEHVFTCVTAARDYLMERRLSPELLVHPNVLTEFDQLPRGGGTAVVMGDAAQGFNYDSLNRVFRKLMENPDTPLIAMGYNRYFREADGLSLDLGPFVKALEFASGKTATITGKPAATFFHRACASMHCKPHETLMIGDDVVSDIEGAMKAGLRGCLVRTGKYRAGDEHSIEPPPDYVADDISSAVEWLLGQN